MAIAFFDLDRTLIAKNSASLWVRSELRGGHITRRTALRGLSWILKYHLGAADMDHALRHAVALLTGMREADLHQRTREFHARDIRGLYRPGALAALEEHRAAGDAVVLLTTSSNYLCEEVCRDLAFDGYLCNRFEVDDAGRYTGRPLEPLCYGPGKVTLAADYARARKVELEACVFYSDSHSDLPMLAAVGRPVVVNPDPRLKRAAKRRGWTVVDWGKPVPQPAPPPDGRRTAPPEHSASISETP
jgi:HAD superfamily hydrolase (TIGR01490 family)